MVGQACLWMVLLFLFETAATFIHLMSLFVVDVASSLEAHVLTFLDLAFVPFRFKPLEVNAFPFESSIIFALAS